MIKSSVFISSVYSEFVDVRHEIINAILQNGDWPVCMERFNSNHGKTADILKKYISDCDYFVLLIGDKYGDIEPSYQISYTEYEYNVALENGLKPLIFLKNSVTREEQTEEFIKRIQQNGNSLWKNWNTVPELATSVITSLRVAEIQDPRDGWVRGGTQIEICTSAAQYTDFVVDTELNAEELIILPKRLNTAYKPESMIREIASQRYGHGIDNVNYNRYIDGHMERSKQFFSFLDSGKRYYELYNKTTLIEYVMGMHHNGIKSLNAKYMLEMLEAWKETIRKYSSNYYVGLLDDILPFKYEIFDRKIVSMHETVGKHSKNRVNAFIIREQSVVDSLVSDFETMWDKLEPEQCDVDYICDWIDTYLIKPNTSSLIYEQGKQKFSRVLNLSSAYNCRDLGGLSTNQNKKTKFCQFIRSDIPNEITEYDCSTLMHHNITKCIDLRFVETVIELPSPFSKNSTVSYQNCYMSEETSRNIQSRIKNKDFKTNEWKGFFKDIIETQRNWIKEIFSIFAENRGAVVFHCSHGKDRTGLVSILLLMLADVKEEEIILDYISSEIYCEKKVKELNEDVSDEYYLADKTNARFIIDYINEKYYNINNYLFSCGLSFEQINMVKNKIVGE